MSAIPFTLYQEIMNDISPAEIEDIDVTIKLANRDTITPLGIVRDFEVLCGKRKYPTKFLVLGSPQDDFCPIIFGRPFLNTVNTKIYCEKQTVSFSFGDAGVGHPTVVTYISNRISTNRTNYMQTRRFSSKLENLHYMFDVFQDRKQSSEQGIERAC